MFLSDQEIINNFRISGQENYAFSNLVTKYQEKVYRLIRKMVIDHQDANDLTQEVFLKIWIKIRSFRAESQLFTWIYRIAINETINFIKAKKRRNLISLSKYEYQLQKKIDMSPDFDGDEIQKRLLKAVLKIPEKQRLVFNLRYYQELSYEEIAEITGTTVGALKASYHLAVKKIEKFVFFVD